MRILYGPRDLIKSIYTVVGGSGVGAALIAYFAVTTFSTGDLFLLSITRVCRLHWSVRRGSRGCRNNAWGNGHCGLRSSPLLAPSDRQVHLSPAQLGLSFGLFNYARGRRYSRRHPLPARRFFLSSARAFGPQKSRKCKKCGIFGVFAWDVAYGAHTQCPASQFGRERRGEAWGARGAPRPPVWWAGKDQG